MPGPYGGWIHVKWVLHFWMKPLILNYLTVCEQLHFLIMTLLIFLTSLYFCSPISVPFFPPDTEFIVRSTGFDYVPFLVLTTFLWCVISDAADRHTDEFHLNLLSVFCSCELVSLEKQQHSSIFIALCSFLVTKCPCNLWKRALPPHSVITIFTSKNLCHTMENTVLWLPWTQQTTAVNKNAANLLHINFDYSSFHFYEFLL